jgi:hypothetical protein
MTEPDIASQDAATLETAPTCYIEGHGIRFAYRRLGPAPPMSGWSDAQASSESDRATVFRCAAHFEANSVGQQACQSELWVGKPAAQFDGRPGSASTWTVAVIPATRRTPTGT